MIQKLRAYILKRLLTSVADKSSIYCIIHSRKIRVEVDGHMVFEAVMEGNR